MSKDNNIDDLFRQGLGDSHVEFNPDNWAKMESMLDQKDKFLWFKRGGIAVAASALLGLVGFFGYQGSQAPQSAQVIVAETSDASLPVDKVADIQNTPLTEAHTIPTSEQTKPAVAEKAGFLPSVSRVAENEISKKNNLDIASPTAQKEEENLLTESIKSNQMMMPSIIANSESEFSGVDSDVRSIEPIPARSLNLSAGSVLEDFAFVAGDPGDQIVGNKNSYLAAMVAMNLSNGVGSSAGLFSNAPLHAIGFKYGYQHTPMLALETGLSYKSLSGNGAKLVYENVDYGFGKTVTTTEVKVQSLHYLELPLDVKVDFAEKHSAFVGASVSYLMNVKSAINTQTDETLNGVSNESKTMWGHQYGFNSTDIALRAGYNYQVMKNLDLGVTLGYGIMDITNNETFNNSEVNNSAEFRVRLQYKLLQF